MLSLIIVLNASGCSNYIRKAVPIPIANPGYETYRVAIAVDYFGVKHILRSECPIGTITNCILIYSRAYSGQVINYWTWTPSASYNGVFELDIAVTDSGTAVIAWNTNKTSGGAHTTLFMEANLPLTVEELMPGYVAADRDPLLVSRFNVVYAISEVFSGSYIALRYRQILGGTAGGWVSEIGVSYASVLADAAVSPSGWLYVAYRHTPSFDICYADNYGNSGDMTNRFLILADVVSYSNPRIDVNGNPETVYLAYSEDSSGANDTVYLGHCPANGCTISPPTFVSEYPLDTSKHWNITSTVDIIADTATTAYYTFAALNDDTAGDYEIFEGYTQSGSPMEVQNISSLSGPDGYPTIGLTASYVPITTWMHGGTDIYEFEKFLFYEYQRKIHSAGNSILTSYNQREMSCNADWGAGIWIQNEAADRAYIIFNTIPTFIPIIIKPAGGSI